MLYASSRSRRWLRPRSRCWRPPGEAPPTRWRLAANWSGAWWRPPTKQRLWWQTYSLPFELISMLTRSFRLSKKQSNRFLSWLDSPPPTLKGHFSPVGKKSLLITHKMIILHRLNSSEQERNGNTTVNAEQAQKVCSASLWTLQGSHICRRLREHSTGLFSVISNAEMWKMWIWRRNVGNSSVRWKMKMTTIIMKTTTMNKRWLPAMTEKFI